MLLHPDEIKKSIEPMGWSLSAGSISKEWSFSKYTSAIDFVVEVSKIADRLDHHPEMHIGYSTVLVSISSHDLGGVSTKCVNLANMIDAL
tara:strand:- start:697 stop:966 length:270 start_codon:yes stop_codon:yes gene_type:complete